jgi:hypothetical protein
LESGFAFFAKNVFFFVGVSNRELLNSGKSSSHSCLILHESWVAGFKLLEEA